MWCILGLGLVGVHVGLGLGLVVGVRLGFIYINCTYRLGLGWKYHDSDIRIQYWQQLQNVITCNYETVARKEGRKGGRAGREGGREKDGGGREGRKEGG